MAKTLAISLVLFGCVTLVIGQAKFCNLKSCRDRGTHTLCAYPSPKPASSCGQLTSASLTKDEIAAILKRHNDYRAYVASGKETRGSNGPQPAAKNLGPLTWSNDLAYTAQRWANQCNYGHDKCRDTADMYVGQNVAYISWSDGYHNDSILKMVDMWYDEVALFDKKYVKAVQFSSTGPDIGHYTQMVWAKTTQLGCGVTRYKKPGQWYMTFLVCNYGPGGNIIGEPIYQTR